MRSSPRVAVFRPDDERLQQAVELLESLEATPIADPMLAIEPTGRLPRADAEFVVFTSRTGVDAISDSTYTPGESRVCAIGETTAEALRAEGIEVELVPETYTSAGLVDELAEHVDGKRIEVARSDHGSDVLLAGLQDAGGYVHETVLYELRRPDGAGESVSMAARGDLDGLLFSSSLTVAHFMAIAMENGQEDAVLKQLERAVVGATVEIPTRKREFPVAGRNVRGT